MSDLSKIAEMHYRSEQLRKFKVLCDFGGGGFNDDDFMSWEIVESETGDYVDFLPSLK